MYKPLLRPDRLLQVPAQLSWIDHRLVREGRLGRATPDGIALYLFPTLSRRRPAQKHQRFHCFRRRQVGAEVELDRVKTGGLNFLKRPLRISGQFVSYAVKIDCDHYSSNVIGISIFQCLKNCTHLNEDDVAHCPFIYPVSFCIQHSCSIFEIPKAGYRLGQEWPYCILKGKSFLSGTSPEPSIRSMRR
jgi:hypothetical protein